MTASKTRAAGTRPAAAFIPEDPDELGGFEEPAESAVSEPEEPAAEPVLAARPGPLGGVARRGKARQAAPRSPVGYRALCVVRYTPEGAQDTVDARAGDVLTDVPADDVPNLISQSAIEPVWEA